MSRTLFYADQIGSFNRPGLILGLKGKLFKGEVTKEELAKVEDEEIKKLVAQEVEVGLKVVTDGEFRRSLFCLDFWVGFKGVEAKLGWPDKNGVYDNWKNLTQYMGPHGDYSGQPYYTPYAVGKVEFNPDHPEFRAFEYLKSVTPAGIIPKVIIPTTTFMYCYRDSVNDSFPSCYKTFNEYITDVSVAFRETVLHFYKLGARVIQIDDPTLFVYPVTGRAKVEDQWALFRKFADYSIKMHKILIKDIPADLVIGYHTCKHNGDVRIPVPFTYHDLVDFFAQIQPHFVSLEYDDPRSGDFTPLKKLAEVCPKTIVYLGIVTTKNAVVEDPAEVEKKIREAATYFPLERLGLVPQCGFGSSAYGKTCSDDVQWAKLRNIVEIAKRIWGSA